MSPGVARFRHCLRTRPLHAVLRLALEYAGFVAACVFALLLLVTRAPLGWLDRHTGLGVRERCIDLISRISPG